MRDGGESVPTRSDELALFRARPDGLAQRLGGALEGTRPAGAAAITAGIGCVALSGAMIALGMVIVHLAVHSPIGRWDDSVERWFAAHRTSTLDDLSLIGSWLAETLTVIAVGLALAVFLAIKRLWRVLGLLVISLLVEVTSYLLITLFVHRHRPFVDELEHRRPFASFPSGHTAAAVAFYFSILVIVAVVTHNRVARTLTWVALVFGPVIVAVSRLYRGMHHPTDVMAGYLMGIGSVTVAVFAVRVASVVATRHGVAGRPATVRDTRVPTTVGARTVQRSHHEVLGSAIDSESARTPERPIRIDGSPA